MTLLVSFDLQLAMRQRGGADAPDRLIRIRLRVRGESECTAAENQIKHRQQDRRVWIPNG